MTIVPVNITEARAFVAAVDALIASVGGEYPGDRETAARDALLHAHAEAVAAAEARGRAAALGAVDAALEAVATAGLDPSPGYSSSTVGLEREQWKDGGRAWSCDRDTKLCHTPTAAILAAAAALGGDA